VVRGGAEYVGAERECCSLVVYAARGLFTVSIEAFRVSGSLILCGSYVGKGVAELHLRLVDDAVRTFKDGREHSGRPARTISGSFPSACLASRLGFR
jgi:hypothetical protein